MTAVTVAVVSAGGVEILCLNSGSHQVLVLRPRCNAAQISSNGGSGQSIDKTIDTGFPAGCSRMM